jgi:hypothetical protein
METLQQLEVTHNRLRQIRLFGDHSPAAARFVRDAWLEAVQRSRTARAGWTNALAALTLQHGASLADKAMQSEARKGRDADYREAILRALSQREPMRMGRP